MLFSLRRKFSLDIRTRRWVYFLLFGLLIMSFGFALLSLAFLMLAPATVETLRSFHPMAIALTAFTAILISSFWLYKGFKIAFDLLDTKDADLSSKLKEFVFHRRRSKEELPLLVALGGGTGLSSLLKGLKEVDVKLTAVVTVTDDGGSSGRLRKDLQILPPGDIRNCIVALSRSESLLSRLFQYRFTEGGEIEGHSLGNLFIAAMTGVVGDFTSAVREVSNILAIKGSVVPVTSDNVQLKAVFEDGSEMKVEDPSMLSFSGYNKDTQGTQTITVTFTFGDVIKETTYEVSVKDPVTVLGIAISEETQKEFTIEEFTDGHLVVNPVVEIVYSDGTCDLNYDQDGELDESSLDTYKVSWERDPSDDSIIIVKLSKSIIDLWVGIYPEASIYTQGIDMYYVSQLLGSEPAPNFYSTIYVGYFVYGIDSIGD